MLHHVIPVLAATAMLGALCAPAGACTLVATAGTLGFAPNGTLMSSELGLSALLTISTTILDGGFTLTLAPPTVVESPTASILGTLEQRTVSLGTLDMNFGYTSGQISKSFPAQLLSAVVVGLDHRLPGTRFADGTYRTRTVVTCS